MALPQGSALQPAPEPVPAGRLVVQSSTLEECVRNPEHLRDFNDALAAGDVPVFKGVGKPDEIAAIKRHLHGVMLNTMEEYVPIQQGARNNMRLSFSDERATVPLWCISWSFFSWNRDLFLFYRRYGDIYRLRNLVSGFPPETFIARKVEHGCAARLCVHFYPSGRGQLGAHTDPLGRHQIATASMVMSLEGDDYSSGGFYLKRANGERFFVEKELELGDVYYTNPACVHGIQTVDPEITYDPLGHVGRWVMLFPVNKTATNSAIGDSVGYDD